jgi:hypothetical protein
MEVVKNHEYYHIKKLASNYKSIIPENKYNWKNGQEMIFGQLYNLFFESYTRNEHRMTGKNQKFYISWLLNHIISVRNNKSEKIDEIENLYEDNNKILLLSAKALWTTSLIIRELIFEEVRRDQFQNYPSRQKCIWLIKTIEGVDYWKEKIKGEIFRVKFTGKIHVGNNKFLNADTFSLNQMRKNAFLYWSGVGSEELADEIIFEGVVKVLERL